MMLPKIGLDNGRKKQGTLIILAISQIQNLKSFVIVQCHNYRQISKS
ncbi:MAG: hypothetical protein WBA93_10540 [Microcoleaceae cyanobacterium]